MPTLFTRIIDGEIPGRFVWKDDRCVAFLTIEPMRPGHTLVVPAKEVDHWIDLDADLCAHVFEVARVIGRAQSAAFKPRRIGVMIVGDEVPHTHVHVVPIDDVGELSFAAIDRNPRRSRSTPRPTPSANACARWAAPRSRAERHPATDRAYRARAASRSRSAAAGVRMPHQNRSRPSTSTVGTPGTVPLDLGDVPLGERIRLARKHDEVGRERRDLVERHVRIAIDGVREHVADPEQIEQRRAVRVGGERHPRPAPHRDERLVPARREHRRQPRVPRVGREAGRNGGADPFGQAHDRGTDVLDRTGRHRVHREPRVDERGRVGEAVLLVVHDDEIGTQRDDRRRGRDPSFRRRARCRAARRSAHAIGTTPSAISVSVADGTNETTRTAQP